MIRRLYALADRALRRRLITMLALAAGSIVLIAAALALLIPLVRALFSGDPASAVPTLIALAVLGIVLTALETFASVYGQRAGSLFILRMHELIGERISQLPIGWFDGERVGTISQLTSRGVTFAANAPNTFLQPVWQATVAPVLVGAVVCVVDPLIGAAMMLGTLSVTLVWRQVRLREQRLGELGDEVNAEGAARVLEFAAAQPAVRAAGPGSIAERSVRAALSEQRRSAERLLSASSLGMSLYNALAYAVLLAVVLLAVWRLDTGVLDGPGFLALLLLQIVSTWFAIYGLPFGEGFDMTNRTLTQIEALMTAPGLAEPAHPAQPRGNSIEFERVTFGYAADAPVIREASFTVPAGSMTAIVGPSGSGKTTIARLIARFFDVQGGAIRIGGVDVRELGSRATLAQVSVVFQDVYLFEDTLRENIRLGRPGASDAEVEDAARRAGVTEIALRLPDGFDTLVGESGGTLSGGERQRVSIARALLKQAPIVLLDEATAALDIESEALIQHGLADLAGSNTLVVIAHRLQTIRQADQIVVLDGQGGIEAIGAHETLLATSPSYAGFWAERSESLGWRIEA